MKTRTLDIPLKGVRDYIQGPDLFNMAIQTVSQDLGVLPEDFEIAFHRMAHLQVELVWDTDTAPEGAFAGGSWMCDGQRARYWMRELDAPLTMREPYPEEEIVAEMAFDDDFNEARLPAFPPYSTMELWVSMIKAMHQRRFADAEGKWVFARAKLCAYDPNHAPGELRVELAAKLGTKLTRNSVYLNETKIGDVFFALM
ncbi:MAG: hypothetical protein OQK05_12120 [Pseudopelagicola sp.]|nr:hypothetical protein [Pseudopelagicola sp.]